MIGIPQIAERLGLDAGSVRRLIARETDNLNLRLQRRSSAVANAAEDEAVYDTCRLSYIIQLVPEALPNRVKIGFSDDPDQRLRQHPTAAPTAKLLKSWSCKRSWDYAAMDTITRCGCKLVLNEVYEGDVEASIERGNASFTLMPDPNAEKYLSEHSPLYEPATCDDINGELKDTETGSEEGKDANR